jgi:hypothetical protein
MSFRALALRARNPLVLDCPLVLKDLSAALGMTKYTHPGIFCADGHHKLQKIFGIKNI